MLRRAYALTSIAIALSILPSTNAMATAQRTFVASNGNDANPCSLTAPCRSLGAAVAQTAAGGQVVVLDSAGYGQVTLTQSVSITAPSGVYAGISVVGNGTGVTIGDGALNIVLRGLTVDGLGGAGQIGVSTIGTGSLTLLVEDCVMQGFSFAGVYAQRDGAAHVTVRNSVITDVGQLGVYFSDTGSGRMTGLVESVYITSGFIGVNGENNTDVTILRSTLQGLSSTGTGVSSRALGTSNNTFVVDTTQVLDFYFGISADILPGSPLTVDGLVQRSSVIGSTGVGLCAYVGATIRISDVTLARGFGGIGACPGTVLSRQNNTVDDNTTNGSPSGTIPST